MDKKRYELHRVLGSNTESEVYFVAIGMYRTLRVSSVNHLSLINKSTSIYDVDIHDSNIIATFDEYPTTDIIRKTHPELLIGS